MFIMNTSILQKNHIKYGLIMSGILLICLTLMHVTNQYSSFEKGAPLDTIFVLAPFVIWFLAIRAYKKELKNRMSFKQGLVQGIKISTVFGIISPIIFMLYYTLFNPGILNYVAESYGMKGAPTVAIIAVDMLVQCVGSIIMGTLYIAILSLFMRSKN